MAKKNVVSQSRTMWVKKGSVVNGQVVKKGYVAQYGKPEKKVSATVKLTSGGSRTYKEGRAVKKPAKPMAVGGGFSPGSLKNRPNNTTSTAQNTGPKSYVGDPGTRKSAYQTGEGMRKRRLVPKTDLMSGRLPQQTNAPTVKPVQKRLAGPATGTFTKSYERSSGGRMTVPSFFASIDQQRRERRRRAAIKRKTAK